MRQIFYIHLERYYQKKDVAIISKLGYNERFFNNKYFKYRELSRLMDKIIIHYENNGYPFTTVKLDSLSTQIDLLL